MDLTVEQFEQFRDFIQSHSGIFLEEGKRDSLRALLVLRANIWGCASLDEYLEVLARSADELNEMLNLVTINETSFFRFPAQFEVLKSHVLPQILESKPAVSSGFRAWSAGCATGEEPYSVAMTLADSQLASLGYTPQVLGTDISTHALDRARRGEYPLKSLEGVDADVVSRYFEPTPGGLTVTRRLREMVEYNYHNLVKEPYPLALMGNWDIIFCRNVTIYFRIEWTRRVVANLCESLNPGGFLFVGHSETLTSVSDRLEPVEVDGVFLYRKPIRRRLLVVDRQDGRLASVQERTFDEVNRAASNPHSQASSARAVRPAIVEQRQVEEETAEVATIDVSAVIAEAHQRLSDGDPVAALRLAGEVLDVNPRSAEGYLIAAYAHADGGDFSAAIDECRRALAISPLVAAARFILGVIYLRLDDSVRAIEEFKRTLYIDSDFVLARFNLANLYRSRGALEDACREYDNTLRSLERSPQGGWTHFMGGFTPELLVRTCQRGLDECRRVAASG